MKNKNNFCQKPGFTLIELLIYVGIVTIILTGVVAFFWDQVIIQSKLAVQQETNHAGRFLHDKIITELRDAKSIFSISPSEICLESKTASMSPVRFYLQNGRVFMGWGGSGSNCSAVTNTAALTSEQIEVSSLVFTNRSFGTSKNVVFEANFSFKNTTGRQEWNDSGSIYGAAEIR